MDLTKKNIWFRVILEMEEKNNNKPLKIVNQTNLPTLFISPREERKMK